MRTRRLAGMVVRLLAMGAAGLLYACGGDAPSTEPYKAPAAEKAEEAKLQEMRAKKTGQTEVELIAKPDWDMVFPHFVKYSSDLDDDVHSKSVLWKYKDAFAKNLEKFYPPAPVEEKKADQGAKKETKKKEEGKSVQSILASIMAPGEKKGEGKGIEAGSVTALTKYPLSRYTFKIIMTGVANPEALVEDPDGETHVVHVNDRIGEEGGYIQDILKQRVLIKLPDKEAPVAASLVPETLPDAFTAGGVVVEEISKGTTKKKK